MKYTAITLLVALYTAGHALHVAPLPVVLPENPTNAEICEYMKARPVETAARLVDLRELCAGEGVEL